MQWVFSSHSCLEWWSGRHLLNATMITPEQDFLMLYRCHSSFEEHHKCNKTDAQGSTLWCTFRIKEVSDGQKKIPFMLELDNGKWLHDSDSMYPYLEDKYTSKKLGKMEELPDVYALSLQCPAGELDADMTWTAVVSRICVNGTIHAIAEPRMHGRCMAVAWLLCSWGRFTIGCVIIAGART